MKNKKNDSAPLVKNEAHLIVKRNDIQPLTTIEPL